MKKYKTCWKSNSTIKFILCFLLTIGILGCSKEDDPEPIPISTPEEVAKSSSRQITSFVFLLTNNPIEVNVVATIDEENKTITAIMPAGTDLSGLLPEIQVSDQALVDPTAAQNFTNPIEYTVTAEDGSSVTYTVTITVQLTQRQILQAILDANPGNTINWDLINTANLGDLEGVNTDVEGNIVSLEIVNGKMVVLPPEIGMLTELTGLYVGENKLATLPPEIGSLVKLEDLFINDNNLTTLPPEIGMLTELTKLNVIANKLATLPPEIGSLVKLEDLYIYINNLTTLPPEIGMLTELTLLYASSNKLATLPPEIGSLVKLEDLDIGVNNLTTLPPEIGMLTELTELYANNNKLTALPPEIGFLSKLTVLFLRGNDLNTIPVAVCYLGLFNNLSLSGFLCETVSQKDALISIYSANPGNTLKWGVDNFPGVDFPDNPKVITLNNKNLSRIPDNINHLNNLEVINANSNKLVDLPKTLGSIATLSVLTLGSNQLNTIPAELGQLSNLVLLSLTNNPITSIPQEVCDLQGPNEGDLIILTDPGEGCND